MALLSTLLLLLAATLTASDVTHRLCHCVFRGNRANMSQQYCTVDEEREELSSCTDELVPRISLNYEYIEPQGLFSVYRIHLRYDAARDFCEQEGARLAVPQSRDVFKKLFQLTKRVVNNRAWIGVNDIQTEGKWVDVDGNKPPVLPWVKGEPNNYHNDEDCGEIHITGLLNDHYCWFEKPFICERRLRKPIPRGYKWCYIAQRFYKIYEAEKTFPEARKVCKRDGGALASIDTIVELRCALWLMPQVWHDPLVDFTDEAIEGEFVDSKGRPLETMEYRMWQPGQPDNGGKRGPHNCVILKGTGRYEDIPCDDTQPFLCELIPY